MCDIGLGDKLYADDDENPITLVDSTGCLAPTAPPTEPPTEGPTAAPSGILFDAFLMSIGNSGLTVFIVILVIVILAVLGYFGYRYYQNKSISSTRATLV